MAGGKGKNKKRKSNSGEATTPSPPPTDSYRVEGGLLTPATSHGIAATSAALQQMTIIEEEEDWEVDPELAKAVRKSLELASLAGRLRTQRMEAEEMRDLAVMAAEAATSRYMAAEERILELESKVASMAVELEVAGEPNEELEATVQGLLGMEKKLLVRNRELAEKKVEVQQLHQLSINNHFEETSTC